MRNLGALGAAALAIVGLAAAVPSARRVEIKQFKFGPQTITVAVGTTVTWTNVDEEPHTVTAAGVFTSRGLDNAETFSYRFTRAGQYTYFCALHPRMTGTVVVK